MEAPLQPHLQSLCIFSFWILTLGSAQAQQPSHLGLPGKWWGLKGFGSPFVTYSPWDSALSWLIWAVQCNFKFPNFFLLCGSWILESELPRTLLSTIHFGYSLCWNLWYWITGGEKSSIMETVISVRHVHVHTVLQSLKQAVPAPPWKFIFQAHNSLGCSSSCCSARRLYCYKFCFVFEYIFLKWKLNFSEGN